MVFCGISRVFSTVNGQQYEAIGQFWDELSKEYGRSNLRGLGYHWTADTIEYVIGYKEGTIPGANCRVELPDIGWATAEGETARLGQLYEEIYRSGPLLYEIETFDQDGRCRVQYCR